MLLQDGSSFCCIPWLPDNYILVTSWWLILLLRLHILLLCFSLWKVRASEAWTNLWRCWLLLLLSKSWRLLHAFLISLHVLFIGRLRAVRIFFIRRLGACTSTQRFAIFAKDLTHWIQAALFRSVRQRICPGRRRSRHEIIVRCWHWWQVAVWYSASLVTWWNLTDLL